MPQPRWWTRFPQKNCSRTEEREGEQEVSKRTGGLDSGSSGQQREGSGTRGEGRKGLGKRVGRASGTTYLISKPGLDDRWQARSKRCTSRSSASVVDCSVDLSEKPVCEARGPEKGKVSTAQKRTRFEDSTNHEGPSGPGKKKQKMISIAPEGDQSERRGNALGNSSPPASRRRWASRPCRPLLLDPTSPWR